MNIQVIGINKCKDTRATQRFFKDRGISFHFADLLERGISKGELNKIASGLDPQTLINKDSKIYKKNNYQYMDFNPLEEILENPQLIITPIIRDGNRILIGYNTKKLKEFISE